jgi:BlaI family penicillinase repressor
MKDVETFPPCYRTDADRSKARRLRPLGSSGGGPARPARLGSQAEASGARPTNRPGTPGAASTSTGCGQPARTGRITKFFVDITNVFVIMGQVSGTQRWEGAAMAGRGAARPTDGELEILRVLWERGPSTVRDVHDRLAPEKGTAFNTTLKLMQIMYEKGLVRRKDVRRPHVYRAAVPEEQMQRRLVTDFLERVFGGSARKLVAALTATAVPDEELAAIRRILDDMEGDGT